MNGVPTSTIKRIRTLFEIADELRQGKDFNITRLTMLKSLCKDSGTAAKFALHLSKLTQKAMKDDGSPRHIDEQDWKRHRRLVGRAVCKMTEHIQQEISEPDLSLVRLWSAIRNEQNEFERQRWGPVRIIKSSKLLIVETALESFVYPEASSACCYNLARQYAERYDPLYGTGLIPASAPFVQDIAEFWARHYLGRGWKKRLGKSESSADSR